MRSSTPADLAGRCPRCFVRLEHCLCARIPTVRTRARFLVIRHANEAWRSSNSARLAALALPNCELLDYGVRDRDFDERPLLAPDTWLLFPGSPGPAWVRPPERIVVVDGSWSQARRMVHRLPVLRGMPRLSLPAPPPGTRRLRRPTVEGGMSTIEAIARAVALLEGEEAAAPLDRLYSELIDRVLLTRGRPGLGSQRRGAGVPY